MRLAGEPVPIVYHARRLLEDGTLEDVSGSNWTPTGDRAMGVDGQVSWEDSWQVHRVTNSKRISWVAQVKILI